MAKCTTDVFPGCDVEYLTTGFFVRAPTRTFKKNGEKVSATATMGGKALSVGPIPLKGLPAKKKCAVCAALIFMAAYNQFKMEEQQNE